MYFEDDMKSYNRDGLIILGIWAATIAAGLLFSTLVNNDIISF